MVKFEIAVPDDVANKIKGRTVCDIIETHATDPFHGKVSSWTGSTVDEYFSIVFLKGILVVSVSENEFKMAESAVNYAMAESLTVALKTAGEDPTARMEAAFNYNTITSQKEQTEVNMVDIMAILTWKFKENAKVRYDSLGD